MKIIYNNVKVPRESTACAGWVCHAESLLASLSKPGIHKEFLNNFLEVQATCLNKTQGIMEDLILCSSGAGTQLGLMLELQLGNTVGVLSLVQAKGKPPCLVSSKLSLSLLLGFAKAC